MVYKCFNIKIRVFEYVCKFKGVINCIGNKILVNVEDFIFLFYWWFNLNFFVWFNMDVWINNIKFW